MDKAPDVNFNRPGRFQTRQSQFRAFFVPLAYGLIPVVGADYIARQLPKFFQHATRVVPPSRRPPAGRRLVELAWAAPWVG